MPIDKDDADNSVRADLIAAFKPNDEGEPLHVNEPGPGDDFHETNQYADNPPKKTKRRDDEDDDENPFSSDDDDAETDEKTGDTDEKAELDDEKSGEIEPPIRWTKQEKETWEALRAIGGAEHADTIVKAQRILHGRNKELEGAFTRRMQEVAEERRNLEGVAGRYKELEEAIAPYREDYARLGVPESQMLRQTLAIERMARNDPANFVKWFVGNQRWSNEKVAEMLDIKAGGGQREVVVVDENGDVLWQGTDNTSRPGASQPQTAPAAGSQPAQLAPEVQSYLAAMQQRLAGLETAAQARQRLDAQAAMQRAGQVLQQFETAQTETGELMFPFYHDVKTDMADIMEVRPDWTMEQAYNAAVFARPELADRVLTNRELAARRQLEQQSSNDARRSRRAGAALPTSSVRVNRTGGANSEKTLRDEIANNMRQFMADGDLGV